MLVPRRMTQPRLCPAHTSHSPAPRAKQNTIFPSFSGVFEDLEATAFKERETELSANAVINRTHTCAAFAVSKFLRILTVLSQNSSLR